MARGCALVLNLRQKALELPARLTHTDDITYVVVEKCQ